MRVPSKNARPAPWEHDREMYKRRNDVERQFRRLKVFRRVFCRFGKLDVMLRAVINFALRRQFLRQAKASAGLAP
jgi:transposase